MFGTTNRAAPTPSPKPREASGGSFNARLVLSRAKSGPASSAAAAATWRNFVRISRRCLYHSAPGSGTGVYDLLAHHLSSSAHIQLNSGKTRVWNAAGVLPPNLDGLGGSVRVGDRSLPAEEQGLMVLGAPLGTRQYKHHHLQQLRAQHDQLLRRIPELGDLQASWLVLLFLASLRCNYQLRMLPPHDTQHFAAHHDAAVAACFTQLLDAAPLPAPALGTAHLPLHMGGLGLTSAVATATPAYWASWADVLPVLQAQASQHAAAIHHMLTNLPEATPGIQAAIHSAEQLRQLGWEPPDC
eukprot:s3763_g3.t1